MKFDDLDRKMRVYETAHDHCVIPDIYIVARLDGRNFTGLTKDTTRFEAPFDLDFHRMMVEVSRHLFTVGFNITYAYTESDEISLLFDLREEGFGRKLRKINSVLAGEASAKFSVLLGEPACFDCRVSQLPTERLVVDYFRWRNEDSTRNALNAHCYWLLRKQGASARQATGRLLGLSVSDKNELLFSNGINFSELPAWQRRGTGLYWEQYEKVGLNPKTEEETVAIRRRIKVDEMLPMKSSYEAFVKSLLTPDQREQEGA